MIHDVLNEREALYGGFTNVAPMVQNLKRMFRSAPSANKLTDVQVEALDNIAQKLARILNGDPLYADSWLDIAGYASLAHEELVHAAQPPPQEVRTPQIKPNSYEAVANAVLPEDPLPVFLTNNKKDKSL